MSQSHLRFITAALLAVLMMAGVSGCSDKGPTWVDEGTKYTVASVERLLVATDISAIADRPTTTATDLRHKALASLRKQGESASGVADMLTSTFEPDTRGVPVYIEKASLEGTSVVVVVEATGPKSGKLDHKRLWVLSEDGSVVLARSR